ncbi:MAG: hypothetical protein JWL63_370 [Rhodocyclales bacterium]|nr:hypothetical protein [Rhodocyclales bacterium]
MYYGMGAQAPIFTSVHPRAWHGRHDRGISISIFEQAGRLLRFAAVRRLIAGKRDRVENSVALRLGRRRGPAMQCPAWRSVVCTRLLIQAGMCEEGKHAPDPVTPLHLAHVLHRARACQANSRGIKKGNYILDLQNGKSRLEIRFLPKDKSFPRKRESTST